MKRGNAGSREGKDGRRAIKGDVIRKGSGENKEAKNNICQRTGRRDSKGPVKRYIHESEVSASKTVELQLERWQF